MAKLNQQKERFAQLVASGMSQAAAYREAYPNSAKWKDSTVWSRSSELSKESEVLGRIAELQGEAAQMAVYTLMEHLGRLDDLSRGAESEGKYAEAIKAEELRGKAAGFYTERQQIDHTTNGESLNAMSPALAAIERFKKSNEPEQ